MGVLEGEGGLEWVGWVPLEIFHRGVIPVAQCDLVGCKYGQLSYNGRLGEIPSGE